MAAVLLDGSAAAGRAVELGSIPGLFGPHESSQLLCFHGWTETKDVANLACIPATIDAISKSRFAQHTLNYKIETVKISAPPLETTVVQGGATSTSVSPAPTSNNNTPGPMVERTLSKTLPGGSSKKGAAASEKAVESASGIKLASAAAAAESTSPCAEDFARDLIKYVASRLDHHNKQRNILLGVGSAVQGKNIVIGTVAKEAMRLFRGQKNLFFLKASGPMVRPNAALRVILVIIPGEPLDPLRRLIQLLQPRTRAGTRIGVLIIANNGTPKPTDVVSVDPEPNDVTFVAKQCTQILAEQGGLSEDVNEGASSTIANETFPLINVLVLEPTSHFALPTVDDVPNQLVKAVSGFKVDFLAIPPSGQRGLLSDATAHVLMAAPKPHVLLL